MFTRKPEDRQWRDKKNIRSRKERDRSSGAALDLVEEQKQTKKKKKQRTNVIDLVNQLGKNQSTDTFHGTRSLSLNLIKT